MSAFSKLKKQIDGLFDPVLKMEFCCSAYPMRPKNGYATRSIPRFYVKLDKKIIWDFPKDFDVDPRSSEWCTDNGISALVREYIDTPVSEILHKEFSGEYLRFGYNRKGSPKTSRAKQSDPDVVVSLTDLFKAADRRIGKEKLVQCSGSVKNFKAYTIICVRLYGWEGIIKQP